MSVWPVRPPNASAEVEYVCGLCGWYASEPGHHPGCPALAVRGADDPDLGMCDWCGEEGRPLTHRVARLADGPCWVWACPACQDDIRASGEQ